MSFNKKITFEEIRSLPFGSIMGSYVPIGIPFQNPIKFVGMLNLTDVELRFSLNETEDMFVFFPGRIAPFTANELSGKESNLFFRAGTSIFVRHFAGAPTVGEVQVIAGYAE